MLTPTDFSDLGPAHVGIDGGVGVGKTAQAIAAIANLLAKDPEAKVRIFVPDHSMAEEMANRCRSDMPRVSVEVYRGTNQPDPDAPPGAPRAMCQRGSDLELIQRGGGAVDDLCGSKPRGRCPFSPEAGGNCKYRAQQLALKAAPVVVMPQSMLGRPAPPFVPGADFTFIDEAFYASMIGGPVNVPLDYLDPTTFPLIPDTGGIPGLDDQQTRQTGSLLHGLVSAAGVHDRLSAAELVAAGLSAGRLRWARGCLLRCMVPLPVRQLPGAPAGTVSNLLGALVTDNERILRLAKLLAVAADIIDGRFGGAALRASEPTGGGSRSVLVRWRDDIHSDWAGAKYGILHTDATMQPEVARVFLPHLMLTPASPIAAPHMRVVQVGDTFLGHSAFIAGPRASKHGQSAAVSKTKQLTRWLTALAEHYKGRGAVGGLDVLVVTFKALEVVLRPLLPANVGLLHFGKLRGQDAFRGVAALVVVSWMQPPPRAVEDEAELLFGHEVARLNGFYKKAATIRTMADGTARTAEAYVHPDANAEVMRQSKCDAELKQAIGRGRGARRSAAGPLDVFVLTSTPIDGLPVNELVTWEDLMRDLIGPVREMQRAGVLPLDWRGREALLAGVGVFKAAAGARPGNTVRGWFRDNPTDAAMIKDAVGVAQGNARVGAKPLRGSSIRDFAPTRTVASPHGAASSHAPGAWPSYRYRLVSARQSGLILVSPSHADPRAVVEALVGPLSIFELEKTTPSAGKHRRARATATPAAVKPAPQPVEPVVLATPPDLPETPPAAPVEDRLTTRLDAITLRLPALMTALEADGAMTPTARRRHMDRFRVARGSHEERERQTIARVAAEVGADALQRTARAAASRALGLTHPASTPASSPSRAQAA